MVCGILLGYLGSYLFVDTVGGWRFMYGASALPALILLAGMVRLALQLVPQATLSAEASADLWPGVFFPYPLASTTRSGTPCGLPHARRLA